MSSNSPSTKWKSVACTSRDVGQPPIVRATSNSTRRSWTVRRERPARSPRCAISKARWASRAQYRLPVGVTKVDVGGIAHGTVGAVALDREGDLAAATSTGGTFGKLEGRIGDTPLVGPGTWADDNIAISCTGIGEHIIRSGGASSIAFRYKSGISLDDAVREMLDEVKRLGGDGGLIAVTRDGQIAMPYNSEGMKRACASSVSELVVRTFADP